MMTNDLSIDSRDRLVGEYIHKHDFDFVTYLDDVEQWNPEPRAVGRWLRLNDADRYVATLNSQLRANA
jgi:hypothetical protein